MRCDVMCLCYFCVFFFYGDSGGSVNDGGEELVKLVGDGFGLVDEVDLVGGLFEDELEDLVGLDSVLVLDQKLGLDPRALLLLVLQLRRNHPACVRVCVLLLLLLQAHTDLGHLEGCLELVDVKLGLGFEHFFCLVSFSYFLL